METYIHNQFNQLQSKIGKDVTLLLRKQDEYYILFKQAQEVKNILHLQLSQDKDGDTFIRFYRLDLDINLPRLIRAGRRVAIAEFPARPIEVANDTQLSINF